MATFIVNGHTYDTADFENYGYVTKLPALIADLLADMQAASQIQSLLPVNGRFAKGVGGVWTTAALAFSDISNPSAVLAAVQAIAALGAPLGVLRVKADGTGLEFQVPVTDTVTGTGNAIVNADSDGNVTGEVLLQIHGATKARVTNDGRLIQAVAATAPADAVIGTGEVGIWFDEATSTFRLRTKRTSDSMYLTAPITVRGDYVIYDSFERANVASPPGRAETGQLWVPVTGGWGITGGKLYQSSTDGANAGVMYIDMGAQNGFVVEVTLSTMEAGAGLLVGYVNSSTYIRFVAQSTKYQLQNISGGAVGTSIDVAKVPASGDIISLEVDVAGSSMSPIVNGTRYAGGALFGTPSTKVGLQAFVTTNARFDNFSVRPWNGFIKSLRRE